MGLSKSRASIASGNVALKSGKAVTMSIESNEAKAFRRGFWKSPILIM